MSYLVVISERVLVVDAFGLSMSPCPYLPLPATEGFAGIACSVGQMGNLEARLSFIVWILFP